MSSNLSCLNGYVNVPLVVNKSINYFHPTFQSDGGSLLSKFSSLITRSTFSSNDIELFLKSSRIDGWKLPTKLISSIIVYSSLTILLFVTCSIIFYIISYSNIKKFQLSKQKFPLKYIYLILLIIIYIFLLIQMIFLIQNLNKTKFYLNKSIEEINKEFNSKQILQHIKDSFKNLDPISIKSNSKIVDGSKLLMIKIISRLLIDYYYIEEINNLINNINQIINNKNIKKLIYKFVVSSKDLFNLNQNLCDYINQNDHLIENKLSHFLNTIYQQFQYFIQILNEQFLNKTNLNLLDNNQQQQKVQSSILLIINLTLLIIIIITIIPLIFLIIIIANYSHFHFNHQKNRIENLKVQYTNKIQLQHHLDVKQLYTAQIFRDVDNISTRNPKSRRVKNHDRNRTDSMDIINRIRNKSEYDGSYRLFLNPIRVSFGFVTILLIILCILSGLFYGFDLFVQSSCRLIHSDQQIVISFATENLIKLNDNFNVHKIVNNLIKDCQNEIHFSKKFFEEFSIELNKELIPIINNLNENIYKQFLISIQMINISSQMHLINLPGFKNRINIIQDYFNQIDQIFRQILRHNSQVSDQFLIETLNEFELFLEKVLESSLDSCPLPINNLLKLDRLICHETANIINGLWLKIFFFMFIVVSVLWIFGLYLYKRFISY